MTFEEKEGLRDPPFIEFSRSDPVMQTLLLQVLRVRRVGAQASKVSFYSLYNELFKKRRHVVKQNATRRSVEHCTPQSDGAWLNELGRGYD